VKRLHLLLVTVAAVVAAVAGVAGARADSDGKVTICHGTASATNPYVAITVSVNAEDAQYAPTDSRYPSFQYDPTFPDCLTQFLSQYSL
jgi:ABC-type sugar transport system substrate-binding protein